MTVGWFPAIGAFLRRDWALAKSYRLSLALELVGTFLSLALFFYLSKLIDGSEIAQSQPYDQGYFAFAVVGLSLLSLVRVGLTAFASRLRDDQLTGTLEALLATPASAGLVIIGSAAYDLIGSIAYAVVTLAIAVVFFGLALDIDAASVGAILVGVPGLVALFAALGVAVAAFTIVFKQVTAVMGLVSTGLALLGGVYFPVEVLPEPLETIAELLPFTWALDVLRAALLGGELEIDKLIGLVSCAALAMPISLWVFGRALGRAKRDGSLTQY